MRRTASLFAGLLFAYALTVGLEAEGASRFAGDEPHVLLAAQSLVEDGDLDVADQLRDRVYLDFQPAPVRAIGEAREGRLYEPVGVGLAVLVSPAFALGGATAVSLLLASVGALAICLGYRLALRVVPDPWALGAAVAVGLSPPVLVHATAVLPELAAGAALAGATLLALRQEERVSRRETFGLFALLGLLPWLGLKFLPAGVVIGVFAARILWRARRRVLATGGVELAIFSLAFWVGINQGIYGGATPYTVNLAGHGPTGAEGLPEHLERAPRLVSLFVDPGLGLLRWAPVLVLAFAGLFFLARSSRGGLARALPGVKEIERAAGLCAAVAGVQLLVAVFLAPSIAGGAFPPRHLVAVLPLLVALVAWGLRQVPRAGAALAVLTVAISLSLSLDTAFGDGSLLPA
ncbi:MAG: hypothetical protein M3433_01610 [Actinomycetota bacterium]|nr:hypothetical protein [Actinomycetota bacterium]